MIDHPWLLVGGLVLVIVGLVAFHRRDRLFTGRVRREAFARWGNKCAYRWPVTWHRCSGDLEGDHQWAFSRGGSTRGTNCQPLCHRIHSTKGTTFNHWYVVRHGWIVGTFWYVARWTRAEVFRR